MTSENIPQYVFYSFVILAVGVAEYLKIVPSGTFFGLIGGLGIGHAAGFISNGNNQPPVPPSTPIH